MSTQKVTLAVLARTAACNAVVDLVDAGGGPGKLIIRDAANANLALIDLNSPAFGAALAGVATANALPLQVVATGAGSADHYVVTDSMGQVIWTGSVGGVGSGEALELSTTMIAIGDTVRIVNWNHTVPIS